MTPLHGTEGKFLLFVYGTLKRGGIRNPALAGQRLVGAAQTVPDYALLDLGDYPGLVHAPGEGQVVHGELYDVDRQLIDWLDKMEGAPSWFRLDRVRLADHHHGEVWAYFYQPDATGRPRVITGLWDNSERPARDPV